MVKLLVKKQLQELFRGFFVDRKKNRARSRVGVILSALGFVVLMVGLLGGIFTALCLSALRAASRRLTSAGCILRS